jgi:glycosyltransferase involved in cell wall biosynthesis
MRVLMLAQFYPPIIGGEERHVINLSEALVKRGHEVRVATLAHKDRASVTIEKGVTIRSLSGTVQRASAIFSDSERRHAPPFPDPELLYQLDRIIVETKPDVVHAHNWLLHSFLPLKRRSRAAFVVTLHDYGLVCATKSLMHKGLLCSGPAAAKCLACASNHYGPLMGGVTATANWASSLYERRVVDKFIPVSQAVAKYSNLVGRGIPYEVVSNFIPDDLGKLITPPDERLRRLPGAGYLLYVGDLSKRKGIPILLDAYSRLNRAPPLVLIGRRDPDTPVDMPANVTVFESWPHAAIMQAWQKSLFGIAPSVWRDPCPTVVMEANAVAKPVVASDIGGLSDLVADGESGFLVPAGDSQRLAEAMQRLIDDPDLCARMAAASARRVDAFRAKSIVPKIERIYDEVVPWSRRAASELSAARL